MSKSGDPGPHREAAPPHQIKLFNCRAGLLLCSQREGITPMCIAFTSSAQRFLFRPFRAGSSDYVFVTFFRAMKLYFWVRPRTRALSKTRSFAAAKSLWKMRRVIRFILAQAPSINDAGVAYRDLRTSAWALSKTCSKRCFTDSILESSFSAVSKLILRILVNIIN